VNREGQNIINLIIGPDGRPMSLSDLPAPDTKRWVPRRKAQVVAAVKGGLISLEDACTRYALTTEEFESWEYAIKHFGLNGLRATRAHQRQIH